MFNVFFTLVLIKKVNNEEVTCIINTNNKGIISIQKTEKKVREYLSKLVFRTNVSDELPLRVFRELVKPSQNHAAIRKAVCEGHMRYRKS